MSDTDKAQAYARASGTQIAIGGTQKAAPVTRPFTIYSGTDITGTATGNENVENYCDLPYTGASRYHLNRPDHNGIFQFFLTADGYDGLAFCLDKFRDGPYGDVPYQSNSFEALFPDATERQKNMLAWVIANLFPAVSSSETFSKLGVDAAATPVLDDNDAYAAVQVAIWVLLGQISPDEVYFMDCATGQPHPKSDRMRAAVLKILEMAGSFADTLASPTQPVAGTSCQSCCKSEFINCCNKGTLPADPREPYLIFNGCPDELRSVCGRLLIGPFRLNSSFTGTPTITIDPLCFCDGSFSASFMDFCGNPITTPGIGDEFYIALRVGKGSLCFQITASVSGTVTRVVTMGGDQHSAGLSADWGSFRDPGCDCDGVHVRVCDKSGDV